METNQLLLIMQWATPALGLLAILFKVQGANEFKQKDKLRLRLLSFYKTERIYSTNSNKKRHYMTISNYLTIVIYTCCLPDLILLGSSLANKLITLIEAMLQ